MRRASNISRSGETCEESEEIRPTRKPPKSSALTISTFIYQATSGERFIEASCLLQDVHSQVVQTHKEIRQGVVSYCNRKATSFTCARNAQAISELTQKSLSLVTSTSGDTQIRSSALNSGEASAVAQYLERLFKADDNLVAVFLIYFGERGCVAHPPSIVDILALV